MGSPKILQIQRDLAVLGFDPGPLDGLLGKHTTAAIIAWAEASGINMGMLGYVEILHRQAEAKRANQAAGIIQIKGDVAKLKPKARDFTRPLYLQIHQTDFWPGDRPSVIEGIKTNLYVSKEAVYEVHPLESIVVDNYSDFVHIEVAWVSKSRKTVIDHDKTYVREVGVWTPERELLLERALVYAVEQLRAKGVNPTLITHRQTYKDRAIDPDAEIGGATYRIAQKHGYRLDFEWVRGSGQSAALWYPTGCGKLL